MVHLESESAARKNARRSLVLTCDVQKGQMITREMLTSKRPGTGISPEKIEAIVGKVAKDFLAEDTVLNMDMFE